MQVMLAPSREVAEKFVKENDVTATVEAEYGDFCVEGTQVTLAHHGSRCQNPAPCNTPNVPTLSNGIILISHLDLDAIGGVLDLMGKKVDDPEFWEGAEYIDVKGPHHIQELSQDVQDKLNAYYAWNAVQPKSQINSGMVSDVTEKVLQNTKALNSILDERAVDHDEMIQAGKKWREQITEQVESRLVSESRYARCFVTDGVFCSSGYYSPSQQMNLPATVVLNTKDNNILVSFYDSEKFNAKDFVQTLWGPDAGGKAGIAGSPRGWNLSSENLMKEFEKASEAANQLIQQEYGKILPYSEKQTPQQILAALNEDPASIANVYYDEDFNAGKIYLETGEIPEEWTEKEVEIECNL